MSLVTSNDLPSNVSIFQDCLTSIDFQASKAYTTMLWEDYSKLQTEIDTLHGNQEFRANLRRQAVSAISANGSATVDRGSDHDGRVLPHLEREEYKHKILLTWWAILREDQIEDSSDVKEFSDHIVALNSKRTDPLSTAGLLAVGNGILVALKSRLVPEPVFQVLANLQQHRDRFEGQDADSVAGLMRAIALLLETRHKARHGLP